MQEHVKAIIDYLKQTEEAKGSEIAKVIGLSSERTRVILAQMEAIEAVGGNKNRKYRLKKEAKYEAAYHVRFEMCKGLGICQ